MLATARDTSPGSFSFHGRVPDHEPEQKTGGHRTWGRLVLMPPAFLTPVDAMAHIEVAEKLLRRVSFRAT